jgi:putative transposase
MTQLSGIKIRIEPNNVQRTMLARHAGCARWAYNWGLNICEQSFASGEKTPSAIDLHRKLVAEVKSKDEFKWLYESSKCAPQEALRHLESAYKNFHAKQKPSGYKRKKVVTKKGERVTVLEGLPQYKKKNVRDGFYLDGAFEIMGNYIKVPYIGWLKCSENIPITEIKNCTVSKSADQWFISYKREKVVLKHNKKKAAGCDLGVRHLAKLSDGKTFDTPVKLRGLEKRLRRMQRSLARKYKKGAREQGKNYVENKKRIAVLHKKIADHRKDGLHQLTSYLAKNHGKVTIEDLNVGGMMKNHRLAKHIANGSFFEFRRQLEYKGAWYGCEIVVADRFFASSKTCCKCSHKQDMPLKKRIFDCEECDNKMDRDLNAAVNLKNWKENKSITASSAVSARGEGKFRQLPVALCEAGIKHQMS